MICLYFTIHFAGNKMQKLLVSNKVQVLPSFNGHLVLIWPSGAIGI